ncbi:hypothetical protein HKX23_06540 [Sulfitobacter sp. KE29]|uniref:hypothetical protein n=1 Tax=Sulfitobacter TaxID=60136 RepID=UPI0007C32304|nr:MULTISPECIES: hypothetical protein [Sulfitobacter]KZY50973.1 hypothetical protein A3734_06605 [Sulfitobacter sp. HI0054]MBO9438798.1 hypothetical protein [Sulfitobacter sp. R18_2]MDF3418006.1 hypothetical protein [Sulfitobacter sp. Ks38]MDF3425488.1 hypothetical protein [Sulfitobacter sp. KE29]MDF3429069.1 hypothetical protein [Sulfitobacter sp. S46]
MRHAFALICAFLPLPALAEMSAAEFEAYTEGKTLYFGQSGAPYGAEIYRENRRVQWSFLDGHCKEGRWYEADGLICFVYEDDPAPQCWSFSENPTGLVARFENDPTETALYEAREMTEPLLCLGPEVGV